jgi:hypothetical protein
VTKFYQDFSNDDLLDLLIMQTPLVGVLTVRAAPVESVPSAVAAHASVEQDAPVAQASEQRHPPDADDGWPDDQGYRPLDSVWYGEEDADLIEQLLRFYPHHEPQLILDATVNGRRFWRGTTRPVVGLDIDPRHCPDVCADNAAMPFRSATFDVVVYDPPHIPNQGSDRSKDFNRRFGLGARSPKEQGYTFAHTYPAFMAGAWRILTDGGILLCKIVDYVHNHRYQWAHIDLIKAGQAAGFTACDCIIKVRKGPIIDPKWKVAHHSRRQHCYWVIFRKSSRCE